MHPIPISSKNQANHFYFLTYFTKPKGSIITKKELSCVTLSTAAAACRIWLRAARDMGALRFLFFLILFWVAGFGSTSPNNPCIIRWSRAPPWGLVKMIPVWSGNKRSTFYTFPGILCSATRFFIAFSLQHGNILTTQFSTWKYGFLAAVFLEKRANFANTWVCFRMWVWSAFLFFFFWHFHNVLEFAKGNDVRKEVVETDDFTNHDCVSFTYCTGLLLFMKQCCTP